MESKKQYEIDRQQAEADIRTAERSVEEKREVINAALRQDQLLPSNKSTNLTRQKMLLVAVAALIVTLLVGYIF